ncbi:hypothetical protein GCM10007301_29150 [Azorhizobium oxalatiphilum]|uniref:Uncharacterized protein n=1 Tax=Azorhizobium oxalatiphilum TaxID=980631 RepID=A0A917C1R6_9HYPH|nr:hypothetical protein [Azorhizobium oxalatiphilum]GGF67610.1 hypothetical protein GCM10007301_29150 [Azorhizobium oxalatiphilum]
MDYDSKRAAELIALNIVLKRLERRLVEDWDMDIRDLLKIEHEGALAALHAMEISPHDPARATAIRAHAELVIDHMLVNRRGPKWPPDDR